MGYEQLEEPLVVQPMSQSFSRSEGYYWENIIVQVSSRLRTQHETGPIPFIGRRHPLPISKASLDEKIRGLQIDVVYTAREK